MARHDGTPTAARHTAPRTGGGRRFAVHQRAIVQVGRKQIGGLRGRAGTAAGAGSVQASCAAARKLAQKSSMWGRQAHHSKRHGVDQASVPDAHACPVGNPYHQHGRRQEHREGEAPGPTPIAVDPWQTPAARAPQELVVRGSNHRQAQPPYVGCLQCGGGVHDSQRSDGQGTSDSRSSKDDVHVAWQRLGPAGGQPKVLEIWRLGAPHPHSARRR